LCGAGRAGFECARLALRWAADGVPAFACAPEGGEWSEAASAACAATAIKTPAPQTAKT
jgi:hypothetical protein